MSRASRIDEYIDNINDNEEAELGNFNASWQYSGDGIALQRSDGVTATARMQGGVLVEQSVENGVSYTAEYQRLS